MTRTLVSVALVFVSSAASAAEPADFDATVQPFFKTYCLRCHDDKTQKGDFRLDNLPRDFTNQLIAQKWGELLFRINSGEMPPKKEAQPKAEELGKVAEWISTRLKEGEAARMRGQPLLQAVGVAESVPLFQKLGVVLNGFLLRRLARHAVLPVAKHRWVRRRCPG